jgi:hypothetical protein
LFPRGSDGSNPRAKLLQGSAWESARPSVCRTLNLNPKPEPEISTLKQQLDQAYQKTALNLPQNSEVRIEVDQKGKETLTISNLDKLDEPESYLKLKEKIESLLPQVDLPEVLLEIHAKTGFMDEFTHLNESFALIEQNWDDMLRVAGSLKLGTVSATEIMRALHRGQNPSTLAKAIGELGRITKTLYLLNYVDDQTYRRRILTQLNRGEGRHSLARAVFHGRRGEVRQRYREGQEEQLGALGLVINVLVLWNTYYMDAALNQLLCEGWEIADEDKARLSPLSHSHFNMLGRYQFSLPDDLKDGGMRPLRDTELRDDLADLELW